MKRISKADTRSQATAYRWSAVVMALPFLGVGAFFALAGFGYTPLPGKANAPLYVIGYVGLAFFLAGATLFVHGARGVVNQRRIVDRKERRHVEPWLIDFPWDRRGVRDQSLRRAFGGILGVALFGAFLVPFNWWAFVSDQSGWFITAFVVIFDLVLVFVIGSAAYRLGQFLKFGHSFLRFQRFPYHPGDELSVGFPGQRLQKIQATLRFIEERYETKGHGRSRSTHLVSYEHFSERKDFAASTGIREVEIEFDIPENPEWVTELSGLPVRYWELLIESEERGIDFRTTFPLPVYPRTGGPQCAGDP